DDGGGERDRDAAHRHDELDGKHAECGRDDHPPQARVVCEAPVLPARGVHPRSLACDATVGRTSCPRAWYLSRPMDTNAVILDAVERVAQGRDDSLVVHSARDANLWVQVSGVDGETALLCEAVGDEYLGRHRELATEAVDKLKALGWQDVPAADFTMWADAETPEQRQRLADLLERTLVPVRGPDPVAPPLGTPPRP